jgi:hypothetical protein
MENGLQVYLLIVFGTMEFGETVNLLLALLKKVYGIMGSLIQKT